MLVGDKAIKWAVTKAVDLLEEQGAESALEALKAMRDEVAERIKLEEGTSDQRT